MADLKTRSVLGEANRLSWAPLLRGWGRTAFAALVSGFLGTAPSVAEPFKQLTLDGGEPAALEIAGSAVEPLWSLEPPESFAPLIFAQLRGDLSQPVVLALDDGAWRVHRLVVDGEAEPIRGSRWKYAGTTRDGPTLWAVLDNDQESLGWELWLLRSVDGGRTWRMGAAPKVSYWAGFEELRMNEKGVGRVTIALDEDYPGGTPDTWRAGLYHYRTEDFGATWSAPEHEANTLIPAVPAARPVVDAGWHRAIPFHELWTQFESSVPARLPPPVEGDVLRVDWRPDEGGIGGSLIVETDYALAESWSVERLHGPARLLVRLRHVRELAASEELVADGRVVERVRLGGHRLPTGIELHLVLDLADPGARAEGVVVQNTALHLHVRP